MATITVPSHDVQPGDVVHFLGRPHLITRIDDQPSAVADGGVLRVAHDDTGWSFTVDGSLFGHRIATPTRITRTAA